MVGYKAPKVSIIIVTFNSQKYIRGCLEAVLATNYPDFEVIIVDNNSVDNTLQIVKEDFPQVRIIKNKENLGYAEGNNLGVQKARGKYLAVLNPDTYVSINWLKPLVEAIRPAKIAVCQPKIMLAQKRDLINLTEKTTHFLGFDWLTDYQKRDYQISKKEIVSFSGSAFLAKKAIFQKIGGFDQNFFMYYEDGDLSWRMRLAGYRIFLVPESVVFHDYKYLPEKDYQKTENKFYLLERNRLTTLIKNYSWKTLVLLCPILIFMETGMNLHFMSKGWWLGKWRGYFSIIRSLASILKERNQVQQLRKITDRAIVKDFVGKIEFKEFDNFLLKYIANPILTFYWSLARKVI